MKGKRICNATVYLPDSEIDMNIHSVIDGVLLSLERFLAYIKEKIPDTLEHFCIDLKERYNSLAEKEFQNSAEFFSQPNTLPILQKHHELVLSCINYVLSLYGISDDYSNDNQHKTTMFTHRKAILAPILQRLKQFSLTVNADWVKDFLQNYADHSVQKYRQVTEHPDLEKAFEADAESIKTSTTSISTNVLIDRSRYAYRVDKCMGYEALKEFNEPKFGYLAICAGDGAIVKKMNKNFELTRSCTLFDGPYCDGITHDTRYAEIVKHEPDSFFQSLEELVDVL